MRDFIITSLQSWDISIGSTIKNTAMEISRQHRVFYVSTPPSLTEWFRHRKQISQKKNHSPQENLYVIYCRRPVLPANSMPFRWLFNLVNYYNNRCIARTIRETIREYRIEKYIHLIDTDIFRSRYLKTLLHPFLSIYYRRDYVIGVEYWKKYGPACEEALVRQSDIVMTNSSYFTAELSPLNSHVYTTNTGVNLQLYDASLSYPQPEDLKAIPSPIIGYTGAVIQRRLDSDLMYAIARKMEDCQFVWVGPEDEHFRQHPLHQLKNVHFLGCKKVEELPAYIRRFDVCINPQIVNPITEGNYPLKIDEYLAMGRPVVATSTHTMRDIFQPYVHLASNPTEWIEAIRTALRESSDETLRRKRIAFAHTHTWENSVKKIYQAIEKYVATTEK